MTNSTTEGHNTVNKITVNPATIGTTTDLSLNHTAYHHGTSLKGKGNHNTPVDEPLLETIIK